MNSNSHHKTPFISTISGVGVGSVMLRRLLPPLILIPTLIGVVVWAGQAAGLYAPTLAYMLIIASTIFILSILIWSNSVKLNQLEIDRQQVEAILRANQEQLRSLIQEAPLSIAMFDRDMRYIATSQRWVVEYGRGHTDLIGLCHYDIHPDIPERWKVVHQRGQEGETIKNDNDVWVQADGSKIWLRWAIVPWHDGLGNRGGIIISAEDITERKQAESALLESHLQFRTLFEASPDAILLIDPQKQWQIEDCNTAACEMNGYTREELIGQSIDFLNLSPGDPVERGEYLDRIRHSGVTHLETFHRRKDGTIIPVEVSTSLITLSGREVVLGIDRDVTERKRAEAALQQSETRLAGVIYSAMDAIISVNSEQRIVLFNAAAEKMFGKTAAEVLGQPLDPFIPDRFRPNHREHIRIFGEVGITNRAMGALGLIAGRRTNGEEFPIEASISQVEMAEGKLYTVILRDVTERRQAEEEILHLNAELEERVEERTGQLTRANVELALAREVADRANLAKSEFLSRMSHELRTPLNAILGFGQLLEMDKLNAQQTESTRHILRAGKYLLGLINEVLDITRVETGNLSISPEPVQVKELIQEMLALVETMAARREIQIQTKNLSTEYVQADRQRLKQILLNLLTNAIKYNREAGQVIVDCVPLPNERLQIRVTDTGPGLTPEKLSRLFIPFERLGAEQSQVEGTGLGLALSRQLAEVMGGTVGVTSQLKEGSTFWIELPTVESPMEQSYHPLDGLLKLTPDPGQPLTQTVLCFEDNLSNLQLIEQILKLRDGIKLLAASDGQTGLVTARAQPPNVILLDLNLPDISGYEVLQRLKAHPTLCDYNGETTPANNLECKAEEKTTCQSLQIVR